METVTVVLATVLSQSEKTTGLQILLTTTDWLLTFTKGSLPDSKQDNGCTWGIKGLDCEEQLETCGLPSHWRDGRPAIPVCDCCNNWLWHPSRWSLWARCCQKRLHVLIDEQKPIDATALVDIVIAAKKGRVMEDELHVVVDALLHESFKTRRSSRSQQLSERHWTFKLVVRRLLNCRRFTTKS